MICYRCNGTGMTDQWMRINPCPECGGVGIIHCCEGLQEQDDGGIAEEIKNAEDRRILDLIREATEDDAGREEEVPETVLRRE